MRVKTVQADQYGQKYGAWTYVGIRVVHSVYQSVLNDPILGRFALFGSSGVVLAGLTARAAQLLF